MRRSILAAATLLALAARGVAHASRKCLSGSLPVASSSTALGAYSVTATDPSGIAAFDLDVTPSVTWTSKFDTNVGWESNDVRQGEHLRIDRNALVTSGLLKVNWNLKGSVKALGL